MRKAEIRYSNDLAGWLTQDENGFHFVYDQNYLTSALSLLIRILFGFRINFPERRISRLLLL